MIRRHDQLDPSRSLILLIDLQEKLLPLIRGHDRLVVVCRKLLQGGSLFDVPVMVTEQYRKGIGRTVAPLGDSLEQTRAANLDKLAFSAWAEPTVRDAIVAADRPQVILAGIETHVCVQQTALDLSSRDYDVFVCADAVGSRGQLDHNVALDRMRQNGVLVTTVESVLFEWCQRCDAERFKAMLEIVKAAPPANQDHPS